MWKKVLLGLLALVLILLVSAALYLNYRMQRFKGELLDEQYLQAKYLEFEQLAAELESRSPADQSALDELVKQYRADPNYFFTRVKVFDHDCELIAAQIAEHRPQLEQLKKYDEQYQQIMADGFVYYKEATIFQGDEVLFVSRDLFLLQLMTALSEGMGGQNAEAAQRLLLNSKFVEGLYDTKSTIAMMLGVYFEHRLNQAIVYLLPILPSDYLPQIKQVLVNIPDARLAYLETLKIEVVEQLRLAEFTQQHSVIQGLRRGSSMQELMHPDMKLPDFVNELPAGRRLLGRIIDSIWLRLLAQREKFVITKLTIDIIQSCQQWIADGGRGDPTLCADNYLKSTTDILEPFLAPMSYIGIMNIDSLIQRPHDVQLMREAVIQAIDAELQRRETGGDQAITIQVDDNQQIVLGAEYGCIESINEPELQGD
ncbi:MAG: hypothetical protein P9M14_12410 [Candidatus Alcyoniella australis]|nr:hypothetical protein [Candidatus Alcyoniella australis]